MSSQFAFEVDLQLPEAERRDVEQALRELAPSGQREAEASTSKAVLTRPPLARGLACIHLIQMARGSHANRREMLR